MPSIGRGGEGELLNICRTQPDSKCTGQSLNTLQGNYNGATLRRARAIQIGAGRAEGSGRETGGGGRGSPESQARRDAECHQSAVKSKPPAPPRPLWPTRSPSTLRRPIYCPQRSIGLGLAAWPPPGPVALGRVGSARFGSVVSGWVRAGGAARRYCRDVKHPIIAAPDTEIKPAGADPLADSGGTQAHRNGFGAG